ncbi:hypothetical protein AALB39_02075 [Lachnospiraceae bacterium 54-53]
MKAKVLGIKKVDYTNKAGKHVLGTSLHTVHDGRDMEGQMVESIYISSNTDIADLSKVKIGCMIDIEYNRYGSVENFVVL